MTNQQIQSKIDAAWVPACSGTETPFMFRGKKYLYMWNPFEGNHAHYCMTDDVFFDKDQWVNLVNN